MKYGATAEIFCNRCGVTREHGLIPLPGESTVVDGETFSERRELCQCRICQDTKIRDVYHCSANIVAWGGQVIDDGAEYRYYPPLEKRRWPSQLDQCLENELLLLSMAQEVFAAFNGGLNLLTAIGCRAIVEHIFIRNVNGADYKRWLGQRAPDQKQDNFQNKLRHLLHLGFLAENDIEAFKEAVTDLGNEAAHQLHRADEGQVRFAVAMVENLIERFYEIRRLA